MKKKILTPINFYIVIILLLIIIIISCYKYKEYFTEYFDTTQLSLILYIHVDTNNQNTNKIIEIYDMVQYKYNEYLELNSLNVPSVKYEIRELDATYKIPTFVLLNNTTALETYIPTNNSNTDINILVELIKKYNIPTTTTTSTTSTTQRPKLTLVHGNNQYTDIYKNVFEHIQKKYKKYLDTLSSADKKHIKYETISKTIDASNPYFVFTDANGISTKLKVSGDNKDKAEQVFTYLKNKIYLST